MRQHQQHKHNNLGTIIARINYSMAKKKPSLAFWRNSSQPIQKKAWLHISLGLGHHFYYRREHDHSTDSHQGLHEQRPNIPSEGLALQAPSPQQQNIMSVSP
jgi:hypothetical protein